jgi:hypothetical protein
MNRIKHLALAVAVASTACTNTDEPLLDPTEPTVLTQDFSGTLTQNGAATFPFVVSVSGSVAAILLTLTPDDTVSVGLGIGLWDGTACQSTPGIWNDGAVLGTRVIGQVTGSTSLCARVYDAQGTLPQPTEFTIRVEHP